MSEEKFIDEKAEYLATFAGAQAGGFRAADATCPSHLQTGLDNVDRMLDGGFDYGHLYVLASAPGMGKTTLADQIAVSISAHGHDVIYVSLAKAGKKVILSEISRIYMGRKFWRKFKCLMPYYVMY